MEKSTSIKEIAKALLLFHSKVRKIAKSEINPFFKSKYADLPAILDSIQEPLQESGLSFCQFPEENSLTTILMHGESGEFLQGTYNLHAEKINPQGLGSAITYARRYALGAILGLNVDNDDDGNKGSEPKKVVTPFVQKPKDILVQNSETWNNIIKGMTVGVSGKIYTLNEIEKKYTITEKDKEVLLEIVSEKELA